MAIFNNDAFQGSANLSLWYKVRANDSLSLADIPEIIPLRWSYFRDNWASLYKRLLRAAGAYTDPDYFRSTLVDLDTFITQERLSSQDKNPFSGSSIYYRFYPIFNSLLI